MIDFTKLNLVETLDVEQASAEKAASSGEKQRTMSRQQKQKDMMAQKQGTASKSNVVYASEDYFHELRNKVEHWKAQDAARVDWRSDLEEHRGAPAEAQDEGDHPYVDVMPHTNPGYKDKVKAQQTGKIDKDKVNDYVNEEKKPLPVEKMERKLSSLQINLNRDSRKGKGEENMQRREKIKDAMNPKSVQKEGYQVAKNRGPYSKRDSDSQMKKNPYTGAVVRNLNDPNIQRQLAVGKRREAEGDKGAELRHKQRAANLMKAGMYTARLGNTEDTPGRKERGDNLRRMARHQARVVHKKDRESPTNPKKEGQPTLDRMIDNIRRESTMSFSSAFDNLIDEAYKAGPNADGSWGLKASKEPINPFPVKKASKPQSRKPKPMPKDTRSDSEKMADAYASPRKGPGGAVRAD